MNRKQTKISAGSIDLKSRGKVSAKFYLLIAVGAKGKKNVAVPKQAKNCPSQPTQPVWFHQVSPPTICKRPAES